MKERLTRNLGLKIMSIVIAFVLWIIINGLIDPVTTVMVENIPVKLLNEETLSLAGKMIEIESGDSVRIKVRAKRSIAETLSANDFVAVADVLNKNEFNTIQINVSSKQYSDNELEVIDCYTDNGTSMLHLSLVDLDSKSFAVTIIPDGNVANGYYIFSETASPNLITVTGSDTQIEKIAKVAVLVNVADAHSDIRQISTVVAYDKEGNPVVSDNLTFSDIRVQVEMSLVPTKEVAIVMNPEGEPAEGYAFTGIEYAPHTVTVAANAADLAKINSIQINCSLEGASNDVETEFNLAAALADQYGNKFKLVNDTEKVSVRAIIEPLQERFMNIDTSLIEFRNLNENFDYEIEQERIAIPVVGIGRDVNQLKPSDLKLYIDCSGFDRAASYYDVVVRSDVVSNAEVKLVTVNIVLKEKTEK